MKIVKHCILLLVILCFMVPVLANDKEEETTNPESINKPGTYFIEIKVGEPGKETTRYIKTTITFPNTKINKKNQEGIDASDIRIPLNTMDSLTDKELIKKANARAWSLEDGRNVPITKVNVSKSKESQVAYTVTFSTKKNTTIISNVYEGKVTSLQFENLSIYLSEETKKNTWSITSITIAMSIIPLVLILMISIYLQRQLRTGQRILYDN
ncbi:MULTISPECIES: hypothetical protein [unclassified Breznakia]|uniref:hypothetical protein n=1 Tax=unclassified Breznakia TaxID=2623764 RepID=UPI002475F524|nr:MULTISPECIES: hypothetical protein [unclassified Breznakia]